MDIKKVLKASGLNIDVDKLAEESAKIPLMLEALIKQGNTQNTALKYIIGTLDEIQKKIDKGQVSFCHLFNNSVNRRGRS
ncbi:unnamed protein product [marine sediment metagenome]|uniref:Uncharacterized protein n=1 Tax=marine sediment metagenome TaxID=412755 RepID=X1PQM3_9ZZZZ